MTIFEAKQLAEETVENGNYSHSVTHWVIVGQGQAVVCSSMDVAERSNKGNYLFAVNFRNGRPCATLHG